MTYTVVILQDGETAKEKAIERAQALLNTVEVWKQSNMLYY